MDSEKNLKRLVFWHKVNSYSWRIQIVFLIGLLTLYFFKVSEDYWLYMILGYGALVCFFSINLSYIIGKDYKTELEKKINNRDVWECEKCRKEFSTEKEAEKHEKNCKGTLKGFNLNNVFYALSTAILLVACLIFFLLGVEFEYSMGYIVWGIILLGITGAIMKFIGSPKLLVKKKD